MTKRLNRAAWCRPPPGGGRHLFPVFLIAHPAPVVRDEQNQTKPKKEKTMTDDVKQAAIDLKSDQAINEKTRRAGEVRRNGLCPCGSGIKFKKCCFRRKNEDRAANAKQPAEMNRNDCYATPRWLAQQLVEEYGITIDACADQQSAVVPRYWGPEQDGLLQPWEGETPFFNPSFDNNGPWVRKAYNEMKLHGVTSVGLLPNRKDQHWFRFAMENAQMRLIQAGHLFFQGFGKQAGLVARIDPVIFIFGPGHPGYTTGPLIVPPFKSDTAKYKVSGIRMFTTAINKPDGALIVRHYDELLPYLGAFARGYINFLVILGWPGLAKSTLIRSQMPEAACWITGNISAIKAYALLYKAIDAAIVMDDVESFLGKAGARELLKQLCESEFIKTLTWETDAAMLKSQKIPNEFQTASKLCFIANNWAKLSGSVMALEDRAVVISFEPSAAEVHEQIRKEGWFKDRDVFDFIGQHLHLIMKPSMRLYVKAKEIKDARHGVGSASLCWESWLYRQWLADEAMFRVAMLLTDDTFPSNRERAEEFVRQGWGARSTFYARVKELRQHPGEVVRQSDTLETTHPLGVPAKPVEKSSSVDSPHLKAAVAKPVKALPAKEAKSAKRRPQQKAKKDK